MSVREFLEQEEYRLLAPQAQKAAETKGRAYQEEESDVRTCYQRDTDRIVHSKAFRRLMHKTQVFLQPEGDHYRTRMTHTLEVSRIARTIARALRLNEDLAEAASLGHDLGHTPFGHAGEVALSEVMGIPFHHNEQSLRVVDRLEKNGQGLNLTHEVRMAILGHTGLSIPRRWRGRSSASPTASPTSTTTSTTPSAPESSPKPIFPGKSPMSWARATGSESTPWSPT